MDKAGQDKAEHVRSAKAWLDKAEQSFRSRAEIQGELNLLLAEAEMKNLRKNHGAGQLVMRLGAAVTALVITAAVWAVFGPALRYQQPLEPIQAEPSVLQQDTGWLKAEPLQYDNMKPVQAVPRQQSPPAAEAKSADTAAAGEMPAGPVPSMAEVSSPREVMTNEQVQETVRAARHSLRSTASI